LSDEPFKNIHPSLVDEAMRVLEIMEIFPQWTINEILEQPAALLDAVVSLKSTGLKMKSQIEQAKQGKV
jgi:hypothetical protein